MTGCRQSCPRYTGNTVSNAPNGCQSFAANAVLKMHGVCRFWINANAAIRRVLGRIQVCHAMQGKEYWAAERKLCRAMLLANPPQPAVFSLTDVHTTSESKSFDYRASSHCHTSPVVLNVCVPHHLCIPVTVAHSCDAGSEPAHVQADQHALQRASA